MKLNPTNTVRTLVLIALAVICALAVFMWRTSPERIVLSLGIRDNSELKVSKPVDYPLAFKITNQGGALIKGIAIPELFFQGKVHLMSAVGVSRQMDLTKMWRTMIYDLAPGKTFESPNYGNLVDYFGPLQDGEYKVWWTLGDETSNTLQFRVAGKKVEMIGG